MSYNNEFFTKMNKLLDDLFKNDFDESQIVKFYNENYHNELIEICIQKVSNLLIKNYKTDLSKLETFTEMLVNKVCEQDEDEAHETNLKTLLMYIILKHNEESVDFKLQGGFLHLIENTNRTIDCDLNINSFEVNNDDDGGVSKKKRCVVL